MKCFAAATAAFFTLVGSTACTDSPAPASPVSPPIAGHPAPGLARLHGTVDVASGTLTFDEPSAGASLSAGAPNAQIYGNQGVTVRIYNSAVVTSAPVAGKKTYTANVGVRNLLAFRIGDEQGAAVPADTMGIYVYVNTNPITVSGTSSPCPTCVVTVKNRDGSLNFNGTNQAYWFYPEILGPANGGKDTTLARKTWIFEADTAVTRFNFDVLVSAAWVSPNEPYWRVDYPGDSLPLTQAEPRWRRSLTTMTTATIVGGNLQLDLRRTKDSLVYFRYDSISSTMNGMIEANLRFDDGGGSPEPQPGFAFDDQTRYVGVFISDSGATGRGKVGFVNGAGAFIATAGATDTVSVKSFRAYRLQKYGTDSATIYVDNVRRLKILYSNLPLTKTAPSTVMWGFTNGVSRTTTTTWDYVIYQLGKATP
jgi:hypothetical protein